MLAIEPRQLALERALSLILRARFEAGVDTQTGLGAVLITVVATQRPAHEVQIRGVIGTRWSCGDSERPTCGRSGIGRRNDALLGHLLQDEVAPGECALRVAPRVVV